MIDSAKEILDCLQKVLPSGRVYPLHAPSFEGRELEYVTECIRTGWVSSAGSFVDRFENELAAFTGARKAVAIVNGTCALHLALILAGVQRDEEVLVPALSFVATANAVCHVGATPHFVDCEAGTLGLAPDKLEEHLKRITERRSNGLWNRTTGRRIAAIVPMHAFGHPLRIRELLAVADQYRIPLVEDAAESIGSWSGDRHTGLFGRLGIISFNGNKTITTGGGGAIITNDEQLAARAKHLSTTARQPHAWELVHDEVAFNYRMPNLNAALGCGQLETLSVFLERKRRLAELYQAAFADCAAARFVAEPPGTRSNYWLCTLLLRNETPGELEIILKETNQAGYLTRPAWRLLSELPMFTNSPRSDVSVAAGLARRVINIPSSPGILS